MIDTSVQLYRLTNRYTNRLLANRMLCKAIQPRFIFIGLLTAFFAYEIPFVVCLAGRLIKRCLLNMSPGRVCGYFDWRRISPVCQLR